VLKCTGVADGFTESMSVLDVASEVADARVEDVVKGVFPEEEVADDAHATSVLVVDPQATQVSDGVDGLLHLNHLQQEVLEGYTGVGAYFGHYILIFLYKTDDGFAVVLGDILGFVLDLLLAVPVLLLQFLLLLAVLILGYSLLMGDHPRFLIETVKGELWQDGCIGELHHRAVLFLLLNDTIQHTIVVTHLIGVWKQIIQLNLA
jgi:hypothetical protein